MGGQSSSQIGATTKTSRIHQKRCQDYIIVWVDDNINTENAERKGTKIELEKFVNEVLIITEADECIRILNEFDGTRSFVITSGAFGQTLVPKIHSIEKLEAVFVFCATKSYHENWSKEWKKVRQVENQIGPICQALSTLVNQVKNDEIAMSIIQTDENGSTTELKQLEPSFMYTGLLKETLLSMEFTSKHILKMVASFQEKYRGDSKEQKTINEFANEYCAEKAIWWYTRQCFVYVDVNRALRDLEGDVIIDMGFFIQHLHQQIEELHQKQLPLFGNDKFILYRGQGLSIQAFENIKNSKGGLLGFNCFLSASMKQSISLGFSQEGSRRAGCVGILFIMTIDPSLKMIPFARIKEHSYFSLEDEVLFATHTKFTIANVENLSDYTNMYRVSLELTNEDDLKLEGLKKYMARKYFGCHENRLGWILYDMGQYDKAEEIHLELLKTSINELDRCLCHHQLGANKDKQGKYREAIGYYEKTIEIKKTILLEEGQSLAITYNQIGNAYKKMGEFSEALINYKKSLGLREKILSKDHPDIAQSYNNIGLVYYNMNEYSKALRNHEKSLEIKKKSLPENHPDLATSHWNLGAIYYSMKQYSKSLEYLEEAQRIQKISLPPTHLHVRHVNDWIVKVKDKM